MVLLLRVTKVLTALISLGLGLGFFRRPGDAEVASGAKYVAKQLLLSSGAPFLMSWTFTCPLPVGTEALTALLGKLPVAWTVATRAPAALDHPNLRPPTCAAFRAVFRYGVHSLLPAPAGFDAHAVCLQQGPAALMLLICVFLGVVFPMVMTATIEGRWRSALLLLPWLRRA